MSNPGLNSQSTGSSSSSGSSLSGIDDFENTSRRFRMLLEEVPQIGSETLLELASSQIPDADLLSQANSSVDSIAMRSSVNRLKSESKDRQRAVWNGLNEVQRKLYSDSGYTVPAKDQGNWFTKGWGAATGAIADRYDRTGLDSAWAYTIGGMVRQTGEAFTDVFGGMQWLLDNSINRIFRAAVDKSGNNTVKRIESAAERTRSAMERDGYKLTEDEWKYVKWKYAETNKIERTDYGDPNAENPQGNVLGAAMVSSIPYVGQPIQALSQTGIGNSVLSKVPILNNFLIKQTSDNPFSKDVNKGAQVKDEIWEEYNNRLQQLLDTDEFEIGAWASWNRTWNGHNWIDPGVAVKVQNNLRDAGFQGEAYDFAAYLARGRSVDEWLQETEGIATDDPRYAERRQALATNLGNREFDKALGDLKSDQSKLSWGRGFAQAAFIPKNTALYTTVSGGMDAAVAMFADPTLLAGKAFKLGRVAQKAVSALNIPALRRLSLVVSESDKLLQGAARATSLIDEANQVIKLTDHTYQVFNVAHDIENYNSAYRLFSTVLKNPSVKIGGEVVDSQVFNIVKDNFERIFGSPLENVDDLDVIFKTVDEAGGAQNIDFFDNAYKFLTETEKDLLAYTANAGYTPASSQFMSTFGELIRANKRIPYGAFDLTSANRFTDWMRVRQVRRYNNVIDRIITGMKEINSGVEGAAVRLMNDLPWGRNMVDDLIKENTRLIPEGGLTNYDAVWNFYEANFASFGVSNQVGMATRGFGNGMMVPEKWRLFSTAGEDLSRINRSRITGVDIVKRSRSQFGRLPESGEFGFRWRGAVNKSESALDAVARLKNINTAKAAQGKLSLVEKAVGGGVRIASKPARVAAAMTWNLTHHVPKSLGMSLVGRDAVTEFEKLLGYGSFADMPKSIRDNYLDRFLRGVETNEAWLGYAGDDKDLTDALTQIKKILAKEMDNPPDVLEHVHQWVSAFEVEGLDIENLWSAYKQIYNDLLETFGDDLFDEATDAGQIFSKFKNFQYFNPSANSMASRMFIERQFLKDIFSRLGIDASKEGKEGIDRFINQLSHYRYAPNNADVIGLGESAMRVALLPVAQHSTQVAIPSVRELWRASKHTGMLSKSISRSFNGNFVEAFMGSYWKPATLMRLGFVPRAAGEEYLAFFAREGIWGPLTNVATYSAKDTKGIFLGLPAKIGEWSSKHWGSIGDANLGDEVWSLVNMLQYKNVNNYITDLNKMVMQATGKELRQVDYLAASANYWTARTIKRLRGFSFNRLPEEMKRSVIVRLKAEGKEQLVSRLGYDDLYDAAVGLEDASSAMSRTAWFQQMMAENQADMGRTAAAVPYDDIPTGQRISIRKDGYDPTSGTEVALRPGHEWIEITGEDLNKATAEDLSYFYGLMSADPVLRPAYDEVAGKLTQTQLLDGVSPLLDNSTWQPETVLVNEATVYPGIDFDAVEPVHDKFNLLTPSATNQEGRGVQDVFDTLVDRLSNTEKAENRKAFDQVFNHIGITDDGLSIGFNNTSAYRGMDLTTSLANVDNTAKGLEESLNTTAANISANAKAYPLNVSSISTALSSASEEAIALRREATSYIRNWFGDVSGEIPDIDDAGSLLMDLMTEGSGADIINYSLDEAIAKKGIDVVLNELDTAIANGVKSSEGVPDLEKLANSLRESNIPSSEFSPIASWDEKQWADWVDQTAADVANKRAQVVNTQGQTLLSQGVTREFTDLIGDASEPFLIGSVNSFTSFENSVYNYVLANPNITDDLITQMYVTPNDLNLRLNSSIRTVASPDVAKMFVLPLDDLGKIDPQLLEQAQLDIYRYLNSQRVDTNLVFGRLELRTMGEGFVDELIMPEDLIYEVSTRVAKGEKPEDVLLNILNNNLPAKIENINANVEAVNSVIDRAVQRAKSREKIKFNGEGIETSRNKLQPDQIIDFDNPELIFPNDGSKLYRGINSDNQWFVDDAGNLHLRANRWGRNQNETISTSTDPQFSFDWISRNTNNDAVDAQIFVEIDSASTTHLQRGAGADPNEIELVATNAETIIPSGSWRIGSPSQQGLERFTVSRESAVADLERVARGQVTPEDSYFWQPGTLTAQEQNYLNKVQQRGFAQYPPRPLDPGQVKRQVSENVSGKANELQDYIQSWSKEDLDLLHRHLQNDQVLALSSPVAVNDALERLGIAFEDLPPQMQNLLDKLPPGNAFGDLLISALKKQVDGDDQMFNALDILTRADRRIAQVLASDAPIAILDKGAMRESLKTVLSRSLNDPNYSYWVQRNQRTLIGSRSGKMTLNPIPDNTENLYTVMVDKEFVSRFREIVNTTGTYNSDVAGVDLILNDLRLRGMTPKEEDQLRTLFQSIQDDVLDKSIEDAEAFKNATLVPLSTIAYRDPNDAIRLQQLLDDWKPAAGQVDFTFGDRRVVRVGSINVPINDPDVINFANNRFAVTIENDGYFNKFSALDNDTQLPDNIRGAANNSAVSLQENMDEYADVLTDTFMDSIFSRDGQIMHEIVAPTRRGTFGVDVMTGIESSDLPASLYAPKQYIVPTNLITDLTRWGFGTVINPAIFAIVRNPMYHLGFMRGYEFARANTVHMRNSFLDNIAEEIVGRTNLDLNELRNAWSMIDYQTSRTLSTAEDFSDELAGLLDDGKINPRSVLVSEDITQDELQNLMDWVRMDDNIEKKNVEIAAQRAFDDMVPYIDDHSVRSFAQEYLRNIFPFLFAQEQFLKRWARSFMYSPEAFRRAQLIAHGATHNGFIHEDNYGNKFFTIPGTETLNSILEKIPVINSLFDGAVHFPTDVPLSLNTRNVLPGIPSDLENLPSVSPLVMIGLQPILEHFPEMKELASAFTAGRAINTNQSTAEMLIPKNYLRIWTSIFGERFGETDGLSAELNRASINAVQQMEAEAIRLRFEQLDLRKDGREEEALDLQNKIDELSLTEPSSPEAKDHYLDRVKQWARANMLVRGFLGLLSPTTPTNVFENEELSSDFTSLLDHMEFDEALTVFLTEHPEGGSFSIFESAKNTKAPIPRTQASLDWMNDNREWLKVTPLAAPWLMPQANGSDNLSQQAFEDMKAASLRYTKNLDEWYGDFKFAAGANVYFPEKTKFDIAIENATDAKTRTALRQQWQLRSLAIRNQHPTFASMLETRITSDAERTIRELDLFLNLPDDELPDVEHIDELRLAVASWKSYKNAYDNLAGNNTKAARDERAGLRKSFILYGFDFVTDYPLMRSFWNSVVLPSLELTSRSAALEQIGN